MLIQETIEEMILDVIHAKAMETERLKEEAVNKVRQEILALDVKIEALLKFDREHREELNKIHPFNRCFLEGPINDLANHQHWLRDLYLEQDLKELQPIEGYDLITYEDFSKATGLSNDSVKKYIEILINKIKITRKRSMGGFCYKILSE